MIDIHTHILPGIDDGARTLEESIEIAEAAVREGIHTLFATPHHGNGRWDNPGREVEESVRRLNEELSVRGIPLTVMPGQEVRIRRSLLEDLESGVTIGLGSTRYLLLELPTRQIPPYTEAMLHELRLLNYVPVVAHPERNRELASAPDKLRRFIELGALAQVTSHSLNGVFGRKLQRLSMEWCRQGMIHLVSSDVHRLQDRNFGLQEACRRITAEAGEEVCRTMLDNASRLLQNEEIGAWMPAGNRKKWWRIW